MPLLKFYKYGNENLPMKVLRNLHEVNDFVNPHNENLKPGTIRQRIVKSIEKGTLFPATKPDRNRWKPIGSAKTIKKLIKGETKHVTVAQRIERQPHLKRHLDPKGILKPKSILAKYYRHRKQITRP